MKNLLFHSKPTIMVFALFLLIAISNNAIAAIALRGTATSATTTSTSLTINKPTGVVAGDVMIVNINQLGNTSTNPVLTGWTLIDGATASGSSRYGAILYRIADGTEGTNFTFTLGTGVTQAVGSIIAFSGVSGFPFDVAPGTINTTQTYNYPYYYANASTITTATNNAGVIFLAHSGAKGTTNQFSNWSGNTPTITEIMDVGFGNGTSYPSVGAAWGTLVTAGATGARTVQLTGAYYCGGILIALRPSSGTAPTITNLSSTSGCQGTSITITGTNLTGANATSVRIGGTSVASITSQSATQIVAVIGTGTTGRVTVGTTGGTAVSSTAFTVYLTPTTAAAGPDQGKCNTSTFTLAGNTPSVGTGAWSLVSGTATITTPSSPTSGVTGVPAGSSATLRWTISNGTCTASTDDVVLTNYANATTAAAGSDQNNCNNGSFTLAGNTPTIGTGLWSVVTGTATITTPSSPTSGVTGVPSGSSATLRWTITNGSCSSTDDVVLTNTASGSWLGTASSDWSDPANWCGGVPISSTDVNIPSGGTQPVINSSTTAVCNSLTIAGSLTNNGTLTISGALSGAGSLTNAATGTLNIGGNATITTLTVTATGNEVNYTGGAQTVKGTTYYDLSLAGSGAKTTTGVSVNNILSMEGTATVSATPTYGSGSTLRFNKPANYTAGTEWVATGPGSGGVIISNTGTITASTTGTTYTVSKLTIESGAALNMNRPMTNNGITDVSGSITFGSGFVRAYTLTGNVTLNSGSSWVATAAAHTYAIAGNFTNNAATFSSSTGTHTFSGTSKTIDGTTTTSIPSVAITGTRTNNGTLTVTTGLSGAGTLTNAGTLNIGGTCSVTTLANSGDVNVTGSGAISTTLANFTNTGTIDLNGSGAITGITNNANGTVNLTNSGTITSFNNATASSTLNISALTVPTINTLTATVSGNTVIYSGSGNQTVKATIYSNLTLSGSGNKTIATGNSVTNVLNIVNTSGAKASLTNGTNTTASKLQFNGTQQFAGTWGASTGSPAPNFNDNAYFNSGATGILTVGLIPAFSNLTASQSICEGTSSITLSGNVSSGTTYPAIGETVYATINSNQQSTTITTGTGGFTINYNPSSIPASVTPYTITYSYPGSYVLGPATNTSRTLTVNANLPVSVSIGASATTICSGVSVTFTATPANGGSTPVYQWKLNGSNVGTNSNTYSNAALNNGDQVWCILTSNATPCATGSPATSNIITVTVNPLPGSATATSPQAFCNSATVADLVGTPGANGDLVAWFANSTGGTALAPSTSLVNATTYYAESQNSTTGCVASSRTPVIANVIPAATANAGPDANGTIDVPFTFSGTSASNYTSLLWTKNGGTGSFTGTTTLTPTYTPASGDPSTITFTLTANGNSPCGAVNDDMTLTIGSAPATSSWSLTAASTNWFDPANWGGTVPGATTSITIPTGATNYPTLTSAATCASITIEDGGSFIGTEYLTVTGTSTAKRNLNDAAFHFLSSPVQSTTFGQVFPNNQMQIWAQAYNPATGWVNQTISNTLVPGVGYSVWTTVAPITATFTGTFNNSGVPVTTVDDTWNLLGNPYPSAIGWDQGLTTWRTGLDNSVYVWVGGSAGNYYTYVGGVGGALTDGIIPPQNGFFVYANPGTTQVTIPLTTRLHSNQTFYKKDVVPDVLHLAIAGNNYQDHTYIHFDMGATAGFDSQFDAYKLYGNDEAPQLYSIVPDNILSVNSLPSITSNPQVPLGLEVGAETTYTITADGMESFDPTVPIRLDDLKLGYTQDLRLNNTYTFSASPGDDENRFNVRFYSPVGVGEPDLTNFLVYSDKGNLVINNAGNYKGFVHIYNAAGQLISTQSLDTGIQNVERLPIGIYVVKVVTGQSTISRKVVLF